MKMVIVMVILVLVVMMAIFTLALAKAAAVKTPMEQMLEDADQRRYLETYMARKRGPGCIDNTSGDDFGQNVESANTDEKKQKRRGLSANLMARWSCAGENWRMEKRKP